MSGETKFEAYLLSQNNQLMSENKALWKAMQQIEYERDRWNNIATVLSVKYKIAWEAIEKLQKEYPVPWIIEIYNRLMEE